MIKKFILLFTFIFLFFTAQTAFAQTTATNNPDSPHELTLQVDKNQAVANGQDAIAITATLKDRTTFEPLENTPPTYPPIANTQLTISPAGGGTNLSQTSQVTDANGQIKAYLTATIAGAKTIIVTDPSLNSGIYATDYYQVSLTVTFSPPGTPTPIPTATPTLTPTPTITPTPSPTPLPTPTPTPWQPTGPIKSDPSLSFFTINPQIIGTNQTAIIKITLLDKDGNIVTDEVPYVTVTGGNNTIIQPTYGVSSLAYFSTSGVMPRHEEERTITVKVDDVQIGETTIKVKGYFINRITESVDISLDNPPKSKLAIDSHKPQEIRFHVSKGRYVDKVTAVLDCGENGQAEIPLSSQNEQENNGQVFVGFTDPDALNLKIHPTCVLRITTQPPENPDEPEEPIEIPIEPIDPFGTIYDAKTGKIVIGVVVTLYELQNDKWVIWDGASLQQINPQTTGESGFYSFFVYPGKYYLTVEKEGYESFTSELIEVIEEIVQLDVYLEPKSNTILWMLALLVPAAFVIGSWFIWQKKKTIIPPDTETSQPLTS